MRRIGGVLVLCFGLAFASVAGQGFAVGGNEVERMYYTCPEDPDSLQECDYEGTYFKPCTGTIIIEGQLVGNFQLIHSESCDGTSGVTTCEWGFSCELTWFVSTQEYHWVCTNWEPINCVPAQ